MIWIMCFVAVACLIYAATAKDEALYWKGRCERAEAGHADRDVIRILDEHKRPCRVPGPAVRLIVGRREKGISA